MRVAVYGFGEIGRILALTALRRGHEIVGAVDIDPRLLGRDVGEILGVERIGVKVTKDVEEGLRECEVILHATGSYLPAVYGQLAEGIRLGKSVVSTCETLAYPYYRYPVLARRLDDLAKSRGSTLIGSGINPGFLLDALAVVLSAPFPILKRIKAKRSLDASKRRRSFIKKIGLGLNPSELLQGLESGRYTGHVGYAESVCIIADAASLNLTRIEEKQEPIIAEDEIKLGELAIGRGMVRGLRGFAAGYVNGVERIRVEFEASALAPEYEEIVIEGEDHSITWRSSGTPGDLGTASVILSIAEKLDQMPYGLLTMADLIPFRIRFEDSAKL
ncbi:MAG: NAD(P)-binding domain-containing protein [Thaumarchaeota archaeon]|nr:NAD(P)-binding domain-containing protein [Nitrososphaerota archaeon]